MNGWYDRQGKPLITANMDTQYEEWKKQMRKVEELLVNFKYKVVKQDKLWWGAFLSTVWLGLDHSFSLSDRPKIFESMIFAPWGKRIYTTDKKKWETLGEEVVTDRYSSEEEARLGHRDLKREYSNPIKVFQIFINHLFSR